MTPVDLNRLREAREAAFGDSEILYDLALETLDAPIVWWCGIMRGKATDGDFRAAESKHGEPFGNYPPWCPTCGGDAGLGRTDLDRCGFVSLVPVKEGA